MKKQPATFNSGALPRFLRTTSIAGLLPALVLLLTIQSSHAGSATWLATPATGDWNTAANWTAGGPPNGSADTATFASSNLTGVSTSTNTEVNSIGFNAGASAFTTIVPVGFTLTISGVGITNNSGTTQNFVTGNESNNDGVIQFTNSATAGSLTVFTNNSGSGSFTPRGTEFYGMSSAGNGNFINNGGTFIGAQRGTTNFNDNSTAGNGTFTTNGSTVSGALGGGTEFYGTSSAGNGNFINNGGADSQALGVTIFFESSTAANGTFINNGGAVSGFAGGAVDIGGSISDSATAGNATLIANGGVAGALGGVIYFEGHSTGGTARVEVFGNGTGDSTNGNLDISFHKAPSVTIGSIEGNGAVFLGGNGSLGATNLTVGSNNLSTTFSGVIQDGGIGGGTSGSLTKIGKGKLTLSKASTYTGGTTVSKGTLLVTNKTGSATGTGGVSVKAGTLGGTGTIFGAVTVASGATPAVLAPGSGSKPGTLTTLSTLAFNAHATYKIDLNSSTVTADTVVANGVTIISGALVSIGDLGAGTLTVGTVFTVINNTAATPIAGTFSNLADGSTLIVGSNTYKANYEGGDGNDLTLTVQ